MTYKKPEVVLIATSTQAIQGSTTKGSCSQDGTSQDFNSTTAAYEADE